MNNIELHNPTTGDIAAMQDIWDNTFGNEDIDLFFKHFYSPELSIVSNYDNMTAAMGYLLPVGDLIINGADPIPTAMIYAVATKPQFQKQGLGSRVSNELIQLARKKGYPAVVLCPAEDSLFDFYSTYTDMQEWFYAKEHKVKAPFTASENMSLIEVSPVEYQALRKKTLVGVPHISFNLHSLEYQKKLCRHFGGGLFQIKSKMGISYAIIERLNDSLLCIKELVSPSSITNSGDYYEHIQNIAAAATTAFPAEECLVRFPATNHQFNPPEPNAEHITRRFAMLSLPPELEDIADVKSKDAWYGLAFD